MKTGLLHRAPNFLLMVVCLILGIVYMWHSPLSLPETAAGIEPAQLNQAVVPPASLGLIGPAAPPAAEEVIPFVQTLYVHGVPYELARQFGPDAVPLLLDLLADPASEPYAANIVATLGFIGHPSARQPLLDYLEQTEGEVSSPQFRGLTSVPYALSQLAYRGDIASLDFLLQASDQHFWNVHAPPWTFGGRPQRLELYHQTLLGLGVSGLPQALARLEQLASQGGVSAQADNEVLQQALELNRRVQQEGMAPVVSPDPNNLAPPAELQDALGTQADDTNPNSHLHTFTVARHVAMGGIPSEAQVDALLNESSRIMQTADSSSDIDCCVALQRSGSVGSFNVTDGTIGTNSELNTIFGITTYQVKMVVSLDYCGGFNTSIVGCAPLDSPSNMILEYLDNVTLDGILWAHEFGHNQGLQHPNSSVSTRIMNGSLSFSARQMTLTECTAWHTTPSNPGAVAGPCPLLFTASQTLEPTSVVTSGATISYVITIVNNSFNPVADITASDSLPPPLTYIPGSATATPPIISSFANFPTTTSPFTLNSNSSVQIRYTVQVGPVSSHQVLVNTATVNAPPLGQPLQASHTAIVDPVIAYLPLIFGPD